MILLNTDVLIDVALDRPGHSGPAARACGAKYIATRNVKDFRQSPIPARTPGELLAELE